MVAEAEMVPPMWLMLSLLSVAGWPICPAWGLGHG